MYAAYLPPGLHSFIIYCPVTKRAYAKDIMINLSESDHYPECPEIHKPDAAGYDPDAGPVRVKKTRANVWRKWRDDSAEDIELAFECDIRGPESTY